MYRVGIRHIISPACTCKVPGSSREAEASARKCIVSCRDRYRFAMAWRLGAPFRQLGFGVLDSRFRRRLGGENATPAHARFCMNLP